MDCAARSDFAKGAHTDDQIWQRIAQGGEIARMGCTRTPDLAHGLRTLRKHFLPTDDGLWARIAQSTRNFGKDCARKLAFLNGLRSKDAFYKRLAHEGFRVYECALRCSCVGHVFFVVV